MEILFMVCTWVCISAVFIFPVMAGEKGIKTRHGDISAGIESGLPETMPRPVIVRVDDNRLKLGDIIIDKKERSVSMPGEVNMAAGMVEYFACSGEGKLHESVLKIYAQPYHIQIALLLLGLKPGNHPIAYQGASEKPCGDPVRIMISWQADNGIIQIPAEELVLNRVTGRVMGKTIWVFTGSQIMDGQFMAQMDGSIISTFHDPFALMDNRSDEGADDTILFANENRLPPRGTKVIMKIIVEEDPAVKNTASCIPGKLK